MLQAKELSPSNSTSNVSESKVTMFITLLLFCAVSPEYSLDPDYLKVPAGSSPCVTFTVTSDPPVPDDAKHTLSKEDGSKVSRRFKVESNRITFHDVGIADSGLYTISCCNDDGEEGQGTVELAVTPPIQPTSQNHCVSQTSNCKLEYFSQDQLTYELMDRGMGSMELHTSCLQ